MNAEQTFDSLKAALGEAGIACRAEWSRADLEDPAQAWAALEVFALQAERVVDEPSFNGDDPVPETVDRFKDGDLLLYEATTFTPGELSISLTRQFMFTRPDGQQVSMKALILDLVVPYQGAAISEQVWGVAGPAWTDTDLAHWRRSMVDGADPGLAAHGASGWRAAIDQKRGMQVASGLQSLRAFVALDDI